MGTPGPQKINRYGIAFKLKAVQMSNQPGVLIKDVAESLCIHPFMLAVAQTSARWRTSWRAAAPRYGISRRVATPAQVEGKFKRLRMEHDLLKKAIRFASDRKQKSLRSSRQTGTRTRSK